MVTRQEKEEPGRRVSAPTVAKRDSERAVIILLRAQGNKQEEVLDYLEGKIFRRLEEKNTHVEWLRFLSKR